MSEERLNRIVESLTPMRLAEVIEALSQAQPAGHRDNVALPTIIDAIKQDLSLDGRQGWAAYIRLREAIIAGVAGIAGMRFVEGES